ncbi:MAG: polysaccharide pyruvyl transferase family protein [Clostridia bacterium]|nr:polysaccharide pyruvyl transferase family protein [Clostridia bacterium]
MNIIVIGDTSSTNLGDPILTFSAEYVVNCARNKMSQINSVKVFDIAGRTIQKATIKEKMCELPLSTFKQEKSVKEISWQYTSANFRSFIKWIIQEKKLFRNRLMSVVENNEDNVFLVAGGALLSRSLFYALRLNEIVSVAQKNSGRVIFNAVGIEKCSSFTLSRLLTKRFLAKKEVVAFSTRDHIEDVPRITSRVDFKKQISDPGIWSAETFNIKKQNNDVVGIGTISLEAYKSIVSEDKRAESITVQSLFDFWYGITKKLDEKGQRWKIFTNGGAKDCHMAYTFLTQYGYSIDDHLLIPAESAEELVEQISQFKAIAAHRLHALIIATSLNIPVVPIVWSDKLVKFSEMIGNDFYLWPDLENSDKVAELLSEKIFSVDFTEKIRKCKSSSEEFIFNSIKEKN